MLNGVTRYQPDGRQTSNVQILSLKLQNKHSCVCTSTVLILTYY